MCRAEEGKAEGKLEHKLLTDGTLMVKMGLSYVKTYFLPVDGTFRSEFVLNRVADLMTPPCGDAKRKPSTKRNQHKLENKR